MGGGFRGRGSFGGGRPRGRVSRLNFGRPGFSDMMDMWSALDPYLNAFENPESAEEEKPMSPNEFLISLFMPSGPQFLEPLMTLGDEE